MKVLLAVDGSKCSEAALAEVAARPWPPGSEIKILTAYELPIMPVAGGWAVASVYSDDIEAAVRQEAENVSTEARLKLTSAITDAVPVTSKFVMGSAKQAILEEAEAWPADLIVVGSHGYGAWQRFWLGSVSQAVVSHAKCSVEVVRCKEARSEEPAAA
jgi:nucleotide-binding universal stress UspA family protein